LKGFRHVSQSGRRATQSGRSLDCAPAAGRASHGEANLDRCARVGLGRSGLDRPDCAKRSGSAGLREAVWISRTARSGLDRPDCAKRSGSAGLRKAVWIGRTARSGLDRPDCAKRSGSAGLRKAVWIGRTARSGRWPARGGWAARPARAARGLGPAPRRARGGGETTQDAAARAGPMGRAGIASQHPKCDAMQGKGRARARGARQTGGRARLGGGRGGVGSSPLPAHTQCQEGGTDLGWADGHGKRAPARCDSKNTTRSGRARGRRAGFGGGVAGPLGGPRAWRGAAGARAPGAAGRSRGRPGAVRVGACSLAGRRRPAPWGSEGGKVSVGGPEKGASTRPCRLRRACRVPPLGRARPRGRRGRESAFLAL
jgi:uncharacterized protein YfiM (DUF2279 family)